MKYRTLSLQCNCGRPSSRIREVGFTADHQLVLHWRCPECKSHVYGVKPLDECWQICPTPDELEERGEAQERSVEEMDVKFLRDLGIRFLEEDDAAA